MARKQLSLRHEALLPAHHKFERAIVKAKLWEREAVLLFEKYPAPEHGELHAGRMRARNLRDMATDATNAAHTDLRRAIRQVGGVGAVSEFIPPMAYRVVLPHHRNHREMEMITLGVVPTGTPVSHSYQLAQAKAQVATWSPRVKKELLKGG
jgi:hypothetical protein